MDYGLLNNVKTEFDWDSYAAEHYVTKATSKDSEVRICCPKCSDTKYKLYINVDKSVFHCFKCSFSSRNSDVFDFVSLTEGIGRFDAMQRLIREYARTTPTDFQYALDLALEGTVANQEEYSGPHEVALPTGVLPIDAGTSPLETEARDYLLGRGLTLPEIRAMKIHYVPTESMPLLNLEGRKAGDLAHRVITPVYGDGHKMVSWQARAVQPTTVKYLSAPGSDLSKTVWPFVNPGSRLGVLTEGVFDALAMRRVPGIASYATFTKKITMHQIKALKGLGVKDVAVLWDIRDAKKEILVAVETLKVQFDHVYVCHYPKALESLDFGDTLAMDNGKALVEEAMSHLVDVSDEIDYMTWQLNYE